MGQFDYDVASDTFTPNTSLQRKLPYDNADKELRFSSRTRSGERLPVVALLSEKVRSWAMLNQIENDRGERRGNISPLLLHGG